MEKTIQYRWAQLDLARQMESLEFIREFMKTMASAGYNGILLYLEDRIRTKTYPYPADGECYTEEEIRGLVAYAQELHLELVPCVATLGHAERFLAHPELEELSELQGEQKGRFGWTKKQTFCPTHPRFYSFLTEYLKEVAALFPSKFFHAGLDEFWDYCLCARCKAAAPDFQGEQALFVKHVEIIRECLAGCGKRMMMWSDMFEYYPDALAKIPKDIVMCDWQYQRDVRDYVHHLFDVTVENRLARNAALGLESFIAPVDMLYRNAESYLEYASDKPFTGCILTCWEKTDAFLYRTLPVFVYAGYLMQGKNAEEATRAMMRQLFGSEDAILAAAVTLALTTGPWRHFQSIAWNTLFGRDFFGMPFADFEADEAARKILAERGGDVTCEVGRRIILDIQAALEEKCISHDLKREFHSVLDGRMAKEERLTALKTRFAQYLDAMSDRWGIWRRGISGNVFEGQRGKLLSQLDEFHRVLVSSRFVKLRTCVPDGYVVEYFRVSLQFEHGGAWEELRGGGIKPQELNTAYHVTFLPYAPGRKPIAIKLEAWGMGGTGICFVEADGQAPKSLLEVHGTVQNPEFLLQNNQKFAWFGSQSTQEAYFSPAMANQVHSVVLAL